MSGFEWIASSCTGKPPCRGTRQIDYYLWRRALGSAFDAEVPLESNKEALAFAAALLAGEFDMVIFLTGVGTRTLLGRCGDVHDRGKYIAALQRVKVVARGRSPSPHSAKSA